MHLKCWTIYCICHSVPCFLVSKLSRRNRPPREASYLLQWYILKDNTMMVTHAPCRADNNLCGILLQTLKLVTVIFPHLRLSNPNSFFAQVSTYVGRAAVWNRYFGVNGCLDLDAIPCLPLMGIGGVIRPAERSSAETRARIAPRSRQARTQRRKHKTGTLSCSFVVVVIVHEVQAGLQT